MLGRRRRRAAASLGGGGGGGVVLVRARTYGRTSWAYLLALIIAALVVASVIRTADAQDDSDDTNNATDVPPPMPPPTPPPPTPPVKPTFGIYPQGGTTCFNSEDSGVLNAYRVCDVNLRLRFGTQEAEDCCSALEAAFGHTNSNGPAPQLENCLCFD